MSPEQPANLFESAARAELEARAPLAARLRPRRLDDVIGQSHLLGKSAALRKLIEADALSSVVFFGPPGTGKTTLAQLIADVSERAFVQLSATSAGVKDVREVLDGARRLLGEQGRQTILFLDEIHRFTRSQQDALLPGVEDGTIVLIGATTENPFFSLNAPLLSRSSLFRFESLSLEELTALVERAAHFEDAEIDADAAHAAAFLADGDGRALLNTIEVAIALARAERQSDVHVTRAHVEQARTTRAIRFSDDEHYDEISALIKSIRGSDPDAAVYWLARLIESGEDPRFLARRLIILASEDVGLADPMALSVATAAGAALDRVGLPEAALNLAEATIYLALAPKSNASAKALWAAQADVRSAALGAVPAHLRDAHYPGAAELGHGAGYQYPHDDPRGWVEASYLPEELKDRRYYEPTARGAEPKLAESFTHRREGTDAGSTDKERRSQDGT